MVVGKINENKSQTYGFDAQTEQYVDMLSAGIVDPAKVVRVALQDAASIAGLMITTKAMVRVRNGLAAGGRWISNPRSLVRKIYANTEIAGAREQRGRRSAGEWRENADLARWVISAADHVPPSSS